MIRTKKTVRVLMAVWASVWALSGFSDTFLCDRGWYCTETDSYKNPITWMSANFWKDLTTGATATRAPTEAEDIVCLTNYVGYTQRFLLGTQTPQKDVKYDFTIAELLGGQDKTIIFPGRPAGEATYYAHRLTITNPDGFTGLWSSREAKAEIVLPATAGHTLALSHVIATNRMFLTVPTAGTAARVASIRGDGAVDKMGDGDLRIESASGANLKLYVQKGSVTIDGIPCAVDAPVPGALYHFDASRIDTMTTEVDGHNRTNVTKWTSLGDTGMYAFKPLSLKATGSARIHYSNAPFLSAFKSPTGLPLMDFGSATEADVATFGPTNCVFNLSREDGGTDSVSEGGSANIREVFYAGYDVQPAKSVPLFGGYDKHDYIGGGINWRYSQNNAAKAVVNGEHSYNGIPAGNNTVASGRPMDVFHVYGDAASAATTVRYLATDRLYPNAVGGWRVGEILMYTNVLTRAQRNQVNRYLMKKWMGQDDCDAGAVVLSSDAGSLGVSAGNTANVRRLRVNGGKKLVKTGAGTLAVDHVSPSMLDVEVQGGDFALTSSKSPVSADAAPASSPALWLDAEKGLTYTNAPGSTVKFVTKWADCRASDGVHTVFAEIPVDSTYYYGLTPKVLEGAANGHDVVTFNPTGANDDNKQTWMRLVPSGENGYEAFIAVRAGNGYSKHTIFGSTTPSFNNPYRNPLDSTSAGTSQAAALWTHNGEVIDPWTYQFSYDSQKSVQVFSVSCSARQAFDLLAKYRTNSNTGAGRLDIGEYLVYDRRLTDAERRDTIAYLTRKWNGTESADSSSPRLGSLSFANGVEPVLASDDDIVVNEVSGAEGKTLVKRGAGAADVRRNDAGSIHVEEGELKLSFTDDPAEKAMFHFDAADLSSLKRTVSGNVTNVLAWSDTRLNGVEATSVIDASRGAKQMAFAYPTLKTIETASGVWRTVVDYGHRNNTEAATKYEDAAAMEINTVVKDKSAREIHVVWADATGGYSEMATARGTKDIDFYRNGRYLIRESYSPSVAHGDFWVDGVPTIPTSFQPGTAGYVLSSVPTSGVSFTSLFMDRNCNAGGGWYGEALAFSAPLTQAERTRLIAGLRQKWFGVPAPVLATGVVSSVSVAAGAKLTVPAGVCLKADAISAAGTIAATAVAAEGWSFGYRSATSWDSVSVSGAVVFDGDSTVTVTAADPRAVDEGEYELVSAASISGLPQLVTVNFPGTRVASLKVKDGKLVLKIEKTGLLMIIR